MRKILNTRTFLMCVIALLGNSCSEDFVTKEYNNGVVDENFYKDETQALQALTAVYDIIGRRGMYKEAIVVLGDCPSDDIHEQTGDNGDYGLYYRAASDYRWESSNPYSTFRWEDAYKGIFRANILLEKLPEIDMDSKEKARMDGEAKFLRALYYFNLVVVFGDVPLVTTVLTREEYSDLGRTEKAEVYAQMEQDLKDAAAVLPVKASDPVGRATKGAANGLLSRIYLYQSKWQDAADAAKTVMDSGTYSLVSSDDFISMFNGQLENGPESLFEFQSVGLAPSFWGYDGENFYSFLWSPVVGWANWFSPSQSSYEQFTPEDIRRKASILVVGADPVDMIDVNGDGIQEPFPSGNMNTSYYNGANCRKFLPEGKDMSVENNFEVNFPIIRYAEILLNYAEAENELGNTSEALSAITKIRARAKEVPAQPTATDQLGLREVIRSERRKELLFEGHRFFDIQRWGIAQEVLGPLGWNKDRNTYWPVPASELDLMPNL